MDTKTTEKTETETAETAETEKTDGAAEVSAAEPAETAVDSVDDAVELLDEQADAEDDDEQDDEAASPEATGIGAGAAAVVSAALSAVALTGTWTGKVVAERETLIGQIKTSGGGTPAQQINEIYGDAWHSTALVNGVFALLALIVAVLVLTLPRRPAWVRAVAVAGAVLGGLGLLLSVGTYFDLFLSLPTTGS
ncbi:hypothetical protein AB0K23_03500 [Streptomyces sp. NPDC049602]|uniref:hypothetical protein n=1 Tax=Streptomyces sp. NPDC049602 TaxID=3155504 RepID=UPI003419D491